MGLFDDPVGYLNGGLYGPAGQDLTSYLGKVASGQFAAPESSSYDPRRSFARNALDPRGIEQAMNVALGIGPGAIKAYHGSPYDFNAFDASKIGTGEGAQAYGHGLYFAENEPVARQYRDKLAGNPIGPTMDLLPDYFKPGNIVPSYGGRDLVLEYKPGANYGEFAAKVQEINSKGEPFGAPRWHSTLPGPKEIENVLGKKLGSMYEVNIKAEPEQFLDWDKPLSQQGPSVQSALDKLRQQGGENLAIQTASPNPTGETFYHGAAMNAASKEGAANPYQPFTAARERLPYVDASAQLRDAGIPGIRYLDQGSRGAGQGTSNYVVFDPGIVEILRKYGLGGLAAGAGATGGLYGSNTQY